MDEIFTYLADLPDGIDEMITPCADGYTIYLDSRLGHAERVAAYQHALRHIEEQDFYSGCPADQIEARAHL